MYALPPPGQVTGVTAADGRRDVGRRVAGPRPRAAAGDLLPDHAVHRRDGADADDRHRLAAGDDARRSPGLTTGTTYTFTRRRPSTPTAPARRPRSPTPSPRRRPSRRPRRPDVAAQPATTSARVTWTAPDDDGDSAITGQTVTPVHRRGGADAGAGRRDGDEHDDHRARQRDGLHVPRHGDERRRHEPALGRLQRRDPAGDDLRLRDAVDRRLRRHGAVELGVKFRADFDGAATGIRFYKAAANTGTHIGSLWTDGGTLLAHGHLHRRDGHRLADRDLRAPRSRSRRTRPTSRRTSRRTATTRSPARLRVRRSSTRRCAALANGDEQQRRLRLRRPSSRFPTRHLRRRATTGSTSSSRPPPRRDRSPA